jgi:hypothetical protein
MALILWVGCSSNRADSESGDFKGVTLTGQILDKNDQVPADGGVTLVLEVAPGQTETLLFPSLFTLPPASKESHELYQRIQPVKVGDRVRIKGTRSPTGEIRLEDLEILSDG